VDGSKIVIEPANHAVFSKQMATFRQLIASAACAALAGLAASGLVRVHLSDIMMSELARQMPVEIPAASPSHDDGSPSSAVDVASEGVTPETLSNSVIVPKATQGHPARPATPRKPVRDTFSQELDRGIRKVAEHRYEIKRRTLDRALGNLIGLGKSVHVLPEVRAGKPFGFRLFAIRADGPFAKLGLRNEDVLVSINGLDLATPEHVLDAYGKLRTAPHLVLGLIRDGQEITLEYTIR
jgi:hypothetical protein